MPLSRVGRREGRRVTGSASRARVSCDDDDDDAPDEDDDEADVSRAFCCSGDDEEIKVAVASSPVISRGSKEAID